MSASLDTTVCVVGGGPAGAVLGLLLARAGIDVTVLEKHSDFLRDFRGDTVHPSTLRVLDEIGLVEKFLALPHRKVTHVDMIDRGHRRTMIDLRLLDIPFPYIAYVPQWDFLNFITAEAAQYSNFNLIMQADAYDVVRRDDAFSGVRYRDSVGQTCQIDAHLIVAADGRHSAIRQAVGVRPRDLGNPMDMVMFPIPRRADDPDDGFTVFSAPGHFVGLINRTTYWHVGYMIHKGGLDGLRTEGAAALHGLHQAIGGLAPFLADRVCELDSLDRLNLLQVQVNRLRTWHQEGLLFIGDAAHAMSPLFGVGVNLAIQDAVATANQLIPHLIRSQERGLRVPRRALAAVQRRRVPPTIATQVIQRYAQRAGIDHALGHADDPAATIPIARIPQSRTVTKLMTRLAMVGVVPEHVRTPTACR